MRAEKALHSSFRAAVGIFLLTAAYAEPVLYPQLPPPVQKQVLALAQGGGKIPEIDRADEGGKVTFTFDVIKGGQTTGYTVNDQGVIESMEVPLAGLPFPVQNTIKGQIAQGGELDGIDKNFEDGTFSYEVTWKSKDGKDHTFNVGADGKLDHLVMTMEELPPAVQATIKKEAGAAPIEEIDKSFDGADAFFEVSITRNNVERTFDVDMSGKLESRQVFLEEVPGPAQATIKQQLGNATINEIDEVFDNKRPAFEVEATKDGKAFNFSVGPKGKFLGYD